MGQSFTSSKGQVLLSGSVLSDHRIDDLTRFFRAREAEAEKAASEARAAWIALESARCEAMDYRHDRVSRSLPLSDAGPVARTATTLIAI